MKKMNRKGFTIVELVIVIAVIAILAGVLIPTFSGIVTKAQESKALQEVKNAYTVYVSDTLHANGTPEKNIAVAFDDYYITLEDGKAEVSNSDKGYAVFTVGTNNEGDKILIAPQHTHTWNKSEPTGNCTTCGTACTESHVGEGTCETCGMAKTTQP